MADLIYKCLTCGVEYGRVPTEFHENDTLSHGYCRKCAPAAEAKMLEDLEAIKQDRRTRT